MGTAYFAEDWSKMTMCDTIRRCHHGGQILRADGRWRAMSACQRETESFVSSFDLIAARLPTLQPAATSENFRIRSRPSLHLPTGGFVFPYVVFRWFCAITLCSRSRWSYNRRGDLLFPLDRLPILLINTSFARHFTWPHIYRRVPGRSYIFLSCHGLQQFSVYLSVWRFSFCVFALPSARADHGP